MSALVMLHNPKFLDNVAAVYRACACWGADHMYYSGDRVSMNVVRVPREFRLRAYNNVLGWSHDDTRTIMDRYDKYMPVAVENMESAQPLDDFQHPEHALYIFGPEDGRLTSPILSKCHRFVRIPSKFSMNLAGAVYTVLYDRYVKQKTFA